MAAAKEKIRVGLLVDGLGQSAWAARMLQRILDSSYASIELVVVNEAPSRSGRNFMQGLLHYRHTLLHILADKLEGRLVSPTPDAMAPVDATAMLSDVPAIHVTPRRKQFSDRFEDADIEKIRAYDIDVFIRLGFKILRGEILRAARHGVWSYHHGDNRVNRGVPSGFWEVHLPEPVTGSILQVLSEDLDGGEVLYRSWSATSLRSVRHNRNNLYWKTLSFLPRMLERLYELGPEAFRSQVRGQNVAPEFYSTRLYSGPKNGEMFRLLCRRAWAFVKRRLHWAVFVEQWCLLYDPRPGLSLSLRRFKELVPPKDRFWADPHVIERGGRHFVFVEEYLYETKLGHISVFEFDEKGKLVDSEPKRVLERPYHLSYPFLFEWDGELFMLPETRGARTVEVYRCVEFPHRWEHHKTLMDDLDAVDATLIEHGGKWWMFVNICENPGASFMDELFLFHADNPLSNDWKPHPCNPIVSDVRSARPAGAIFEQKGVLFRPSQDSSQSYGYGTRINEIIRLDEHEYEEREVGRIEPEWNPQARGIHTLSHAGRLTVMDARMRRRRWF